ncbi:MAG: DUF4139 domain-containing protein [Cardiobacteriaceae bacterium]|nr:DUF4139 domain-containing protein [Cardiobacteriaceae bacterium]
MTTKRYGWALWLLPMLAAQAAEFHPPLQVVSATLYPRHADVLRQTQLDIREAGTHRIWLAEPLQGTGGGGDVVVNGAQVLSKTVLPNENAVISNEAERVTAARMRLENTRRALGDNERLAAAWAKRLERPDSNPDDSKAMLAQLADEHKILTHRHLEAERALLRASAIENWEGRADKLPLAVVLDVVVDQPGTISVQWREQTEEVYWQPRMRLSLASKDGHIDWQAEAAITQQSGLNFDNVQLKLALAAAEDADKPPFQPLTLRLGEARPHLQERALAALELPVSLASGKAVETPPVETFGSVREVALPGRYNVPSGVSQTLVSYASGSAKANTYRAIYTWAKAESALVMAEFTLPDNLHAFVPGDVQIYRDGALIAKRAMPRPWHGGETFHLSFGEDLQFQVSEDYPSDYKDSKGLIVRENIMDYRKRVSVTNRSGSTHETRIYAQLPVAGEKDIVVKPAWPQMPEASDADGIKGLVYWQKNLRDGESWQLDHGYSVSYPDGKQVIGL